MNKCPITGKTCLKFKAFSVTNVQNNKADSLAICEDCLHQIDDKNIIKCPVVENEPKPEAKICCPSCGLSLEELLKKSRLGCKECYDFFQKPLIIAFEKLQRTPSVKEKELKHVGKVPVSWKKKQAEETDPKKFILELKQKMALSIRSEDYRLAGELKNIIKGFEALVIKLDSFENDQEQKALIKNQISDFIFLFREKELEK